MSLMNTPASMYDWGYDDCGLLDLFDECQRCGALENGLNEVEVDGKAHYICDECKADVDDDDDKGGE